MLEEVLQAFELSACPVSVCSYVHQVATATSRVESGSDDPDNVGHLGHLFDGSSGSHPRTKLSGYDPDFLVH